ncbi:hypothetical protein PG988_013797 [Apiospora saccharicola]
MTSSSLCTGSRMLRLGKAPWSRLLALNDSRKQPQHQLPKRRTTSHLAPNGHGKLLFSSTRALAQSVPPPLPTAKAEVLRSRPDTMGMEWYTLSTARRIQFLLNQRGDSRWGWAVYRCSYDPKLDHRWDNFKRLIVAAAKRDIIAGSSNDDAPEVAEKQDWHFVEDPALEGASREDLKGRFRQWARAEAARDGRRLDESAAPSDIYGRGSRYEYFIQVDEEALRSLPEDLGDHPEEVTPDRLDLGSGHVNIVRAWADGTTSTTEEGETLDWYGGSPGDAEDWMKIRASMVAPYFYVELDSPEAWWPHFTPPPDQVSIW